MREGRGGWWGAAKGGVGREVCWRMAARGVIEGERGKDARWRVMEAGGRVVVGRWAECEWCWTEGVVVGGGGWGGG